MSGTPHRPFVPKRTPKERPVQSGSEFRLTRPFVHGQARAYATPAAEPSLPPERPVASIADFLAMDTEAPFHVTPTIDSPAPSSIADYLAHETLTPSIAEYLADDPVIESAPEAFAEHSYELPPVDHFTDTISASAVTEPAADVESLMDPFAPTADEPPPDSFGWEETDWQRYDWRSAGALGDGGDMEATNAWAETDWGKPPGGGKDVRESAAKAIADALDGIARRIREGDLVIPPPPASVPDPATIAATLAALLGVRR